MDDPRDAVDEDVLRRIAVEERTIQSPYNEFETLVAKVERLVPFLVDVARRRACTHYGAVARECGVHTVRQGRVLGILGLHEDALGRPLLPAVVAKAGGERVGDGYFELVRKAPNRPDDLPDDDETRQWIWDTHREAVYEAWGERAPEASAVESG